MLIFNCSKLAEKCLSNNHSGQYETVMTPALAKCAHEDTQYLDIPSEFISQWFTHSFESEQVQFLIVMEANTKYCMLLPYATKDNALDSKAETSSSFYQQFMQRWIDSIHHQCQRLNILNDDMKQTIQQSLSIIHQDVNFHCRMNENDLLALNNHAARCADVLRNIPNATTIDIQAIETAINDGNINSNNPHAKPHFPAQCMINELFANTFELPEEVIKLYNSRYKRMQHNLHLQPKTNQQRQLQKNRSNVVSLNEYRTQKKL